MGLQLRMTHSLGQRLVEVEARRADQAIVVGRASNAEVQIPSANVSKRHCLLFVHEGRWVVQDADSPSGTFLNGERLTEAAFVNTGDVISLGRGSNPPTLTVDPHSVGVTEEQEESPAAQVPAAAQVQAPPAQWSAPSAPPAGRVMPPPLMPPQPQSPQGFVQEDDSDNIFGASAAASFYGPPGSYAPPSSVPGYGMPAAPPADEWGGATAPAKPRRRVARPQGTSGTTIAVTAVIAMVIVIGGGMLIYNNYQKSKQVEIIKLPAPGAGQTTQPHKPNSIFEEGPSRPRPEKSGAADAAPGVAHAGEVVHVTRPAPMPVPVPPAATTQMEAAADKRPDDPEWDDIERARSQDDPPIAIAKFQDYLSRSPGTPNKALIEKYTNESLDSLWWSRLAELFTQRDQAQKEIASRKLDISQSKDPEFKKGLEKEIAKFTETRNEIDSTIHDQMKFTGQTAPNPYSPEEKSIARKTRDEEYYEKTWKPAVLRSILSSHGQKLPWRSVR